MPPARSPAAGLRRRKVFLPLVLLLPLILLTLILTFPSRSIPALRDAALRSQQTCDYADGGWVPDSSAESHLRYDHTCKDIFKGWNCIANGKRNGRALLRWRWKPAGCELLPRLDPLRFLERHRNTNIGFVGDSLNRNMFVSLVCMLRGVNGEVRKWRPAGADRGFTFLRYNLTLAYHRTNLLVRYGRWWSSSKFDPIQSPMLFFEKGKPIIPPLLPPEGLDLTLKHMITFANKAMRPNGLKFFSTQSPRHFEGGDWNEGGSCQRDQPLSSEEVKEFFSLDNNGTNREVRLVNQHLIKALEQSSFRVLNVTHMSEFRADAHPATTGGKKHDDCMHWCLPGPTDAWNDLLAASLAAIQR
ncbi:hypothetical protein ACQJBY_015546 [Aegilops geniculata]